LAQFILQLKNDPQQSGAMGCQGRLYFEANFTLGTIADQYLSVITKVSDQQIAKSRTTKSYHYADEKPL
jgi:glycosyltransferase involved in cell wall biosynthesis